MPYLNMPFILKCPYSATFTSNEISSDEFISAMQTYRLLLKMLCIVNFDISQSLCKYKRIGNV
jgi:hypothetical protein